MSSHTHQQLDHEAPARWCHRGHALHGARQAKTGSFVIFDPCQIELHQLLCYTLSRWQWRCLQRGPGRCQAPDLRLIEPVNSPLLGGSGSYAKHRGIFCSKHSTKLSFRATYRSLFRFRRDILLQPPQGSSNFSDGGIRRNLWFDQKRTPRNGQKRLQARIPPRARHHLRIYIILKDVCHFGHLRSSPPSTHRPQTPPPNRRARKPSRCEPPAAPATPTAAAGCPSWRPLARSHTAAWSSSRRTWARRPRPPACEGPVWLGEVKKRLGEVNGWER